MITFICILGIVVASQLAPGVGQGTLLTICIAIGLSRERYLGERSGQKEFARGIEWARFMIQDAGWWFSSDRPTMNLIHNLAKGVDTWEARNQWNGERLIQLAEQRLEEQRLEQPPNTELYGARRDSSDISASDRPAE